MPESVAQAHCANRLHRAHRRNLGAVVAAALLGSGSAFACQDVTNLNVKYNDFVGIDGSAVDGGVEASDAGGGGAPTPAATPGNDELEACPCDETQGLSCCVSSIGPAFCTTDRDRCNSENGALYGCFGPDDSSESVCCWHGTGALALTAYAADCDGGVQACTRSSECANGEECIVTACAHVQIGGCGQLPTCPPGTSP